VLRDDERFAGVRDFVWGKTPNCFSSAATGIAPFVPLSGPSTGTMMMGMGCAMPGLRLFPEGPEAGADAPAGTELVESAGDVEVLAGWGETEGGGVAMGASSMS
jgi:hypothetical protein